MIGVDSALPSCPEEHWSYVLIAYPARTPPRRNIKTREDEVS